MHATWPNCSNLARGIPVHSLGAGIPTGNNSFQCFTNNRVVRTRNNRSKSSEVFFGSSPSANITDGTGHQYPTLCFQRAEPDLGWKLAAFFAQAKKLHVRERHVFLISNLK
jgi:hypothetical protein